MISASSSLSPLISASKTPGAASMSSCKSLAIRLNIPNSTSPCKLTVNTGKVDRFISFTVGSSASQYQPCPSHQPKLGLYLYCYQTQA